jgi:hypothetical protein
MTTPRTSAAATTGGSSGRAAGAQAGGSAAARGRAAIQQQSLVRAASDDPSSTADVGAVVADASAEASATAGAGLGATGSSPSSAATTPTVAAPVAVEVPVGTTFKALDCGAWYDAKVVKSRPGHVRVHFIGWSKRQDCWLSVDSERLRLPKAYRSPRTRSPVPGARRPQWLRDAGIAEGSKIFLSAPELTVTVAWFDAVGQRHLVHHEPSGDEWFEILEGAGRCRWELLWEPPLVVTAPTDAAASASKAGASASSPTTSVGTSASTVSAASSSSSTGGLQSCAQCEAEEEEEAPPTCPVCLCPIEDDLGVMRCCGKPVHQDCVAQWRRSGLKPSKINNALRYESGLPDTRKCVWCGEVLDGCASLRRMFSSERPVH